MAKTSDEEIRKLKAENERLRKELEMEKLRSKAYDTMIDVAEDMFNIPIRKAHIFLAHPPDLPY